MRERFLVRVRRLLGGPTCNERVRLRPGDGRRGRNCREDATWPEILVSRQRLRGKHRSKNHHAVGDCFRGHTHDNWTLAEGRRAVCAKQHSGVRTRVAPNSELCTIALASSNTAMYRVLDSLTECKARAAGRFYRVINRYAIDSATVEGTFTATRTLGFMMR